MYGSLVAAVACYGWLWLLLVAKARGEQNYVPGKAFDRFITIWLENQDYSAVSQNPDILSLAKSGILLTSFYGLSHPSQPNYIASVGGDYFGLDNDDVVRLPNNVSTVVDLFDTKGISWMEYMEDVPGPGYMGGVSLNADGKPVYVRKHKYDYSGVFSYNLNANTRFSPLVSFDSVANNGTRLANILSFREFNSDLSNKNLPQYAHLTPNMTNDGHDSSLSFAATWTKNFLTPLLKNSYFTNRTLVLLTYDESETYSKPNKIVSILLGDAIPSNLRGTKDDTFYTHYSILSTLENNFGLPNLGRYDVGANVFDVVTKMTGHQNNNTVVDKSKVDLSASYPGFLNSADKLPIPYPNTLLQGAGGPILEEIKQTWGEGHSTPYDGSGKVFDKGDPPVYMDMAKNTPAPVSTSISQKSGGAGREDRGMIVAGTAMVMAMAMTMGLFLCI